MPVNRNALVRYKTIDNCLRNHYRQWTLDDLIEACSEVLYDHEGIDKGVSKRSIQADIQMMRSDKLGYNAPIIVVDRKYYTYEDPEYSITNIPLTDQDLGRLSEAVEFLKQFQGFSHFKELGSMVQKLEDHIYSQKTKQQAVIDFEKNENLKGLDHLDVLYQAIINRLSLNLTYQSFKARQASSFDFHPYLLKEFRNRWFLIGSKKKKEGILTLALDRIIDIEHGHTPFTENPDFKSDSYFKDAIGVSVSPSMQPQEVLLQITRKHAPYVLTKPLHHSQQLVEKDPYGITISLMVVHNFELEKEILGFGDGIKVIAPPRLKRSIKSRLATAVDTYNTELNEGGLVAVSRKLEHKGFGILNFVYSQREIKHLKQLLDRFLAKSETPKHAQRRLLREAPELKAVLFNKNLRNIVRAVDEDAFMTKAMYFDKPPQSNWFVTWHQDATVHVKKKVKVNGYSRWTAKNSVVAVIPPEKILHNTFAIRIHLDDTDQYNGALQVVPGSHHKQLSDKEIKLISSNCTPFVCEVGSGGIQLMRPLLLHASSKSMSQKKRRVIHLEFSSSKLKGELAWAEKEKL